MKSGVYAITCIATGDRYIGSTSNLSSRRSIHFSSLRRGSHQTRALQELADAHGINNIRFDVLEHCENHQTFDRERWWIQRELPSLNVRTDNVACGRKPLNRMAVNVTLPKGMAKQLT